MSQRVVEHLNTALHRLMQADDRVYFIGEDVLDPYGGAFKVARGLSTAFPDRVITTPISELGLAGVANGLALAGQRPIAEFMFGDFIFLAADQIINFAAKSVTMYGETVPHPVLFRCPVGGQRGYGPTHSQCVQKHFIGVPNLDLYELSPLHDLTHQLPRILDRGRPAILFESKVMYAQPHLPGEEVDDLFSRRWLDTEQMTASVGIDDAPQAVIVTTGGMFATCQQAARQLFLEFEIEVEIVVPFQLYPFAAGVLAPILKHKVPVFVVEEGTAGGTWGSEVAATIRRDCADYTGAVDLIHSRDSIIPSARHLEREVLVQPEWIVRRIAEAVSSE